MRRAGSGRNMLSGHVGRDAASLAHGGGASDVRVRTRQPQRFSDREAVAVP